MADQVFMYATTAGVMIGLAIVISRTGRRSKGVKATISGHEGDKGRKPRGMIRMANPFMNKICNC